MRKINQQLAKVDTSGTISMLEKMKNKVQEEESLAEAYGKIAAVDAGVDSEIDKALAGPPSTDASDSLADLKKRMGIEG
jgi:phage shock protein A